MKGKLEKNLLIIAIIITILAIITTILNVIIK